MPFAKAAQQCGLLLDEWTEVVPGDSATTGIAFHYDQPNSEPPQAMLLVTPRHVGRHVAVGRPHGALRETLELAAKRAVEPAQIDATAYARFLPATITAATLYGISIATAFAANNARLRGRARCLIASRCSTCRPRSTARLLPTVTV